MTTCRGTIAKVLLIAVNIVSLALALALVVLGSELNSYYKHNDDHPDHSSPNDNHSNITEHASSNSNNEFLPGLSVSQLSIILIATGCIIAIIAFIGLGAAICSSSLLLSTYVYLLALSFVTVLFANFAFCIFAETIFASSGNYFRRLMSRATGGDNVDDNGNNISLEMAVVQQWQTIAICCGSAEPADWRALSNASAAAARRFRKSPQFRYGDDSMIRSLIVANVSTITTPDREEEDHKPQYDSGKSTEIYPDSCCGRYSPPSYRILIFGDNETIQSENDNNRYSGNDYGPVEQRCTDRDDQLHTHGCFAANQIRRYKVAVQLLFVFAMLIVLLLLTLACCLDRDRDLQCSLLINMQYVAHLNNCRSSGGLAANQAMQSVYRPWVAGRTAASVSGSRAPMIPAELPPPRNPIDDYYG